MSTVPLTFTKSYMQIGRCPCLRQNYFDVMIMKINIVCQQAHEGMLHIASHKRNAN